jgi:hypothetical protein
VEDVTDASNDEIGGRGKWHGHVLWEPGKGVGYVLSGGAPHPSAIAAVEIEGGSYIPSVNTMGGAGFSKFGLFMDEDSSARWCKGGVFEVEVAKELLVSGEFRVEA